RKAHVAIEGDGVVQQAEVEHPHHTRVRERRGRADLVQERAKRTPRGEQLERHPRAFLVCAGLVHHPGAACPSQPKDPIGTDLRHVLSWIGVYALREKMRTPRARRALLAPEVSCFDSRSSPLRSCSPAAAETRPAWTTPTPTRRALPRP